MSWQKVKLGEITSKIGSGATPRGGKNSYSSSGISLIRSLNVYDFIFDMDQLAYINQKQADELSNVVVQEDDVLLNITGASVARCCIVPKKILPARVNQHVAIIRIDKSYAIPRYVFYYLVNPSNKQAILNLAQGGATREALTKSTIENYEIQLPSLYTQTKIASILSAYDDSIENNTRRIQILEQVAQTIYKEWFVNFRFPGHENTKFFDSSLGKIPQGWKVTKLGEIAEFIKGKSYKSSELSEEGYPFANLKCIQRGGGFRLEGLKRFIGSYKENQKVVYGDIVFAVTDMTQNKEVVGRPARIPKTEEEFMIISLDLVKIRPLIIEKSFLYAALKYSSFGDEIKELANGVNVLHLNPKLVEEYKIILPTNEIRIRFSEMMNDYFNLIDTLNIKSNNLRRTRDLLLPKLMSREVEV